MSDITLERTMPCNLEAERAVLGAILLEPTQLFAAVEAISRDDFYLESHRRIFGAMLDVHAAESAIDAITIKAELQRKDDLEAAGGAVYLAQLTDGMPRAVNVKHYANVVREQATKRRVILLANEATVRCYEGEDQVKEIIESIQMELLKLATREKRRGWIKAADLIQAAYKEIDEIAHRKTDTIGLSSGFSDLDRLTQGFHDGQLILIAGRPGHGKTSLAMNIVGHAVLREEHKAAVFSIEMTAMELAKRLIYSEAEVDSYRAGGGFLTREDWGRLGRAASEIANTKLFVDEAGSLTIMQLRSRVQQLAIECGVDLVVVDYLQLMAGTGTRRDNNRVQEITEISRGLKTLAKDLNIPIIAVSQLNRSVEQENRKPRLSDLRESGSLEQDADVVLFVWRDELRKRLPENEGLADLIIGKQRNGPVGHEIKLQFLKHFTKFKQSTRDNPDITLPYSD
jgi:replicative DNA helicase